VLKDPELRVASSTLSNWSRVVEVWSLCVDMIYLAADAQQPRRGYRGAVEVSPTWRYAVLVPVQELPELPPEELREERNEDRGDVHRAGRVRTCYNELYVLWCYLPLYEVSYVLSIVATTCHGDP
jgi:hypothetical protein